MNYEEPPGALFPEGGDNPEGEELQRLKLRAFPLMLQALYNAAEFLGKAKDGDEYQFAGDNWEATYIDADMLVKFLHKHGLDPRSRVRSNPDGTVSIRHIDKQMVTELWDEFTAITYARDNYIDSLGEEISALKERNSTQHGKILELQAELKAATKRARAFERALAGVYSSSIGDVIRGVRTHIDRGVSLLKSMSGSNQQSLELARWQAKEAMSEFSKAGSLGAPTFDGLASRARASLKEGENECLA